jgi:hypothetical protein
MLTWQENRSIHFTQCAIFRIPTSEYGDVYMRAERPNYNAEKHTIVEVDAERFLALWRQPYSSHEDVAHGTQETWPSDRKYEDAAGGFAHGVENPVPLAEVSCGYDKSETIEVRRRFLLFKQKVVISTRT